MRRPTIKLSRLTGSHVLLIGASALAATLAATVSVPAAMTQLESANAARSSAERVAQQVRDAGRIKADKSAAAAAAAAKKAIPASPELDQHLTELQRAVTRTGATWTGSRIAASPATVIDVDGEDQSIRTWTVTLQMRADQGQVAELVERLGKLPRLTVVDSIVTAGPGTSAASVSARVFALPEKK